MNRLRIALRYLRSKSSHSVVNLISKVSLGAIATPVAAVIILLSIFNGFGEIVEDMASVVDAPLTLESRVGQIFPISSLDTAAIRRIEGVKAISLGAEQTMLLSRTNGREGKREVILQVRGVEPSYGAVTPLPESVDFGDSRTQYGDIDKLLLGRSTGYKLGVNSLRGNNIELYAIKRKPITSLLPSAWYNHSTIELGGLFTLDAQSEEGIAFTSLRAMQELMQSPGGATALYISTRDDANIKELRANIEAIAGDDFTLKDKYELNSTLYTIIKGEKRAIMLIAILVMILASFTLIGVEVMQLLDKRTEITPLRSMGASKGYIRTIFINCGLLLTSIATLLGAAVGVLFSLSQQWWGIIKIPTAGLMMDTYPMRLEVGDVIVVIVTSIAISALLSVVVVRLTIKQMF